MTSLQPMYATSVMSHKFYAIVFCHSRENGNPDACFYWIPASAGMTAYLWNATLDLQESIKIIQAIFFITINLSGQHLCQLLHP